MSLSKIATEAGLRKASLYHHFPSKQAMYLAVLDEMTAELRQLIESTRLEEGSFAERLDRLGALMVSYFGEHPDVARILTREMVDGGLWMAAGGSEAVETTLELTASFLEAGMDDGAFRRRDPRQLALSIVGIHIFYFATSEVASVFLGDDVFTPGRLREREAALLEHVRSLCLETREPCASRRAG